MCTKSIACKPYAFACTTTLWRAYNNSNASLVLVPPMLTRKSSEPNIIAWRLNGLAGSVPNTHTSLRFNKLIALSACVIRLICSVLFFNKTLILSLIWKQHKTTFHYFKQPKKKQWPRVQVYCQKRLVRWCLLCNEWNIERMNMQTNE